jgi:hypothetical protein
MLDEWMNRRNATQSQESQDRTDLGQDLESIDSLKKYREVSLRRPAWDGAQLVGLPTKPSIIGFGILGLSCFRRIRGSAVS